MPPCWPATRPDAAWCVCREAQGIALDNLESCGLVDQSGNRYRKLLQIVLFGQPELDAQLGTPRIRQLKTASP